jgi:C-terminal binding protein
LINTARGKIIKDLDLIYEYLMNGHLSCIAFDVLPVEPPTSAKLIDAWKNNIDILQGRVIINPHTAFFSQESLIEVREKASNNAKAVLLGHTPSNIVN